MRFLDFGKRVVFAAFDGGEITTDAGVLLLRERARRIRLFERMAACFTDRRDPARAVHTLPALLSQRVAGASPWATKTSTITTPCATIRRASSSPTAAARRPRLPAKRRRRWPANRRSTASSTHGTPATAGTIRYPPTSRNSPTCSSPCSSTPTGRRPHASPSISTPPTWRPTGARRTPSSTATTNTAASCRSTSSATAISSSPSSDPPTSTAPGARATRSAASSG